MSPDVCPDGGSHTPTPRGYVEAAEDAERRLARGETQHQCPTCGLWAIWRLPCGRRALGSH